MPLTGNITDFTFGVVGAFVNLQPGGWVGYNVTHVLTQNTSNLVTAYGFDQYKNLATDSDSAFVQVYSGVDISLTVTPSKTLVLPGTPVSYLYNATNTGEVPLTGAIIDDTFGLVGNFVNLQPNGWVGYNVTHVLTQNTTNVAKAWGADQFGANVTDSKTTFVQVYSLISTIESCNQNGVKKDYFVVGNELYVVGAGYLPSTTYDVYLVEDVTWVDGMAIPPRVVNSTATVTSDGNGDIQPTLLWDDPLKQGKYDIIVDVDGDGLYYAEADALDDNDVEVTAGLFVVPEPAVIACMFACFSGLGLFLMRKRKQL